MRAPLAALLVILWALPAAAQRRPNVVIVLADDLGVNDLRVYGRKDHATPNLDRLAAQGTRFTSAYVAQPICSPSRAALLTGKAPARLHLTTFLPGRPDTRAHRVLHPPMRKQLPPEERTIAELFKAAGYATAAIGKWHLGGKGAGPADQGFDVVFAGKADTTPSADEGGKGEYALEAEAERFITDNRERPFFLYLSHNNPHVPLAAKPVLVAKNRDAWNPLYAAVIETLDDTVGRLLAHIDRLGLAEETLVLFTSDNGGLHVPEVGMDPPTHNSPFRAGKGFLYEGGVRVPLIVRWPGRVPAGRVQPAPVINTDLLPTLLEIARLPVPPGLDGRSFARALSGRRTAPRPLSWHFPHYTNQGGRPAGAVRDGRWKLIEPYDGGAPELYDLDADPGEATDLASRHPGRVAAMRAELARFRKRTGAQENRPNPNADEALAARLYRETDVSRVAPRATAAETGRALAAWRAEMDAVTRTAGDR